ncbi:TonB-dependent receptor [Shewanella eurypsychrophilus]|uniref:TonB-dependent receptor n=1 Tax=Shewanella eurypsychrophilus TaxID=2593656 RepID=A0ABX6V3L8_9GAMM|nr:MULTISPECIES: TonB-dependent receptor [Shewanella]QFU21950.1 TonB-dependent receptor plug domain-containing protein [Shewanella sp. YLB-09]QPG57239.1 TonB-dependent receptor [Shewanella eurypsychrophilus]
MPLSLSKTAIATRCALLCLALPSLSVIADEHNTSNNSMERMIITGSRSVERIDEVPSSVTLIDNKMLKQDILVSSELQNILAFRVPGMAPSSGTSSNSGQTLRGRQALIMIDGVPQSTPLRNGQLGIRSIDAATIERIEVIKGATSIYGNGASGGIINYITKKASSDDKARVQVGASSKFSAVKFEDTPGYRFDASIDGTVDNFSYVVSGAIEETGLQRDAEGDVIGLKYGLSETQSKNLFTKLGYAFDEEKYLQLTYNYYDSQQETDYVDVVGSVNSGVKTYAIKDTSGVPKIGEPQGPRGNHNLMLKYVDDELFTNTQLTVDGYAQIIENMFFYSTRLSNPSEGYAGGQSYIKSDKKGLRVNFNTQVDWDDVEVSFIYGLDALNDVSSQPLDDGRIWVPEMDMTNLAAYLQTKIVIYDDWIVKAGIRQDSVDLKVDDYQALKVCIDADTCSVPMNVTGGTIDYDTTTFNVGIRYNMNDYFSPFMSFSQGSDISDLGRLLRTATVDDISLIQTEASIVDNYEVGISGAFEDFSYEIAAFRSESELGTGSEYIEATGVYMPVREPQKIWGYEGQINYQIQDNLSTSASYSWIEGKNTDKDTYLDGKTISAPKFTATLNWQPVEQANIGINYLYVGDRKRFEPVNDKYVGTQGPVSSYNLVNLSSSYQIDNWQLSLGIENLLNEDYYSARSQAYTYSGYNTKGLGTTVNLGVKATF